MTVVIRDDGRFLDNFPIGAYKSVLIQLDRPMLILGNVRFKYFGGKLRLSSDVFETRDELADGYFTTLRLGRISIALE